MVGMDRMDGGATIGTKGSIVYKWYWKFVKFVDKLEKSCKMWEHKQAHYQLCKLFGGKKTYLYYSPQATILGGYY
jgi:hypothetical protein